jgi:membrane-bound ClpP family serine protease
VLGLAFFVAEAFMPSSAPGLGGVAAFAFGRCCWSIPKRRASASAGAGRHLALVSGRVVGLASMAARLGGGRGVRRGADGGATGEVIEWSTWPGGGDGWATSPANTGGLSASRCRPGQRVRVPVSTA